jgi:hypothetical protein
MYDDMYFPIGVLKQHAHDKHSRLWEYISDIHLLQQCDDRAELCEPCSHRDPNQCSLYSIFTTEVRKRYY